jgi:hypothetical protein
MWYQPRDLATLYDTRFLQNAMLNNGSCQEKINGLEMGREISHHPSLCDFFTCHDCIASFGIAFRIKNNHRMSRMYFQPKPLAIHASAILFTTIFDKENQ